MIKATDIIEAYLTRLPSTDERDTFEVFKNPTFKELRSADSSGAGVRFSADMTTKTVYVWDVQCEIHDTVHRELGIKGKGTKVDFGWSSLLLGIAEQHGSKYVMTDSDLFRTSLYYSIHSTAPAIEMVGNDWSWVDRYILVTPFLIKMKEKLEKI